jgi:hypothetical protein
MATHHVLYAYHAANARFIPRPKRTPVALSASLVMKTAQPCYSGSALISSLVADDVAAFTSDELVERYIDRLRPAYADALA